MDRFTLNDNSIEKNVIGGETAVHADIAFLIKSIGFFMSHSR